MFALLTSSPALVVVSPSLAVQRGFAAAAPVALPPTPRSPPSRRRSLAVHLPTSGASPGLDPPLTVSLSTLVVAVDGGTIGLDVSFGAFLAVILGLFIPVVFLVTLYIQSEAQGTATSFREADSLGGKLFDDPADY
ncbi:hypothetical protein EMIHUDRAFT_120577 [Emiliania huxleyi CCMP1516]|uniref:Uncharacterized protein n=2 Tax=Emiliania huxleyi TaxID=2903 RepID=A0A0D3IGH5_EMIH1|nr:hypothetical protein EMIHUDRAFT_120577 [Emiliania huxleyi CCMP1516]EOD10360.1 hypothetical protein EMIHUDRAFT_120577 [Emiliania huxleyi CCMP1516]|eukprot:XP_005762789.1 hypothetical protein EMIHUDRAFT_120577 [Emiliania huxleyi CCMP1516]